MRLDNTAGQVSPPTDEISEKIANSDSAKLNPCFATSATSPTNPASGSANPKTSPANPPKTSILKLFRSLDHGATAHFAASLSFHTLLSIIPVLFVSLFVFSSLPSFGEHIGQIKAFIYSNLLIENSAAQYLDRFLANSAGLTAIGLLALALTGGLFFSEYEFALSRLTGTPKRPFWRALAHYWTLISLMPLGLGVSFWGVALLQRHLGEMAAGFISIFLPHLIIWAIFSILYAVSIKTCFKAALISGLAASLVWSLSRFAFIKYSFYNAAYATIYGSFSILLFFFLWVYVSWMVFLYGLRLCIFLSSRG